MSNITLTIKENVGTLSGVITRQNVPTLSEKQLVGLYQQPNVVFDLSAVSKIDTAGLAWLLLQVEIAQANACQLSFEHLPSSLIKLAALSSVDSLLPLHTSS